MRFSKKKRLGEKSSAVGKGAVPEVAKHDPGARRVLRLFTGSPGLTRAMGATAAAVPRWRQGIKSDMLEALEEVVDQSREVSAEVRLVHCQTQDGRAGQQLVLHALALVEQANAYVRAGLSTSDPDKIKADLSQGVALARASMAAGAQAVKLLSQ
jgi:hypothetical protein